MPFPIRAVFLASLCALAGCTCQEPTRPNVPPEPVAAADPEVVADPEAVPEIETDPEAERETEPEVGTPARGDGHDGVAVPSTLLRQLQLPQQAEPPRDGPVELAVCALGCAVWAPDGALLLVLPTYEESAVPRTLDVTRVQGATQTVRTLELGRLLSDDAIIAYEESGGGEPPWAALVGRALGELSGTDLSALRWAESLVARRARTFFSLDEYAPLVSLGGAFEDRWLFAEVGETSHRIHLLRADRTADRLLATLPLEATACDGGFTDTACVEPLSIEAAYASPDGRFLHVITWSPVAGHGQVQPSTVLSLPLDDASAIPAEITAGSRTADLERSLSAPGAMVRLWAEEPEEDAEPAADVGRAAGCRFGCALFLENGAPWVIRASSLAHGEPLAPFVFRPDGTSAEILSPSGASDEERAAALERALAEAPSGVARPLVARQAIASWRGTARAALVELRTPHARARLGIELEGHEYVLSWITAAGRVEAARAPALEAAGRPSPPGILEAFAPPRLGFPIVVVGAAATRLPSHAEGLEHGLFHLVVPSPPRGANVEQPRRIRGPR